VERLQVDIANATDDQLGSASSGGLQHSVVVSITRA
jgi:hypothetical protein